MVLLIAGIMVTMFAYGYLARHRGSAGGILPVLAAGAARCDGAGVQQPFRLLLPGAGAVERLALRLALLRAHNPLNLEAGMKYLVLSSVSSAFLLFGMALVYADAGHHDFRRHRRPCCRRQPVRSAHPAGDGIDHRRHRLQAGTGPIFLSGFPTSTRGHPRRPPPSLPRLPKARWSPCCCASSSRCIFSVLLPLLLLFSVLAIASMFIGNLLACASII